MYKLLAVALYLFGSSSTRSMLHVEGQSSVHNELRQLHIITHHGASFPLTDLHPDETTELTASGEKQMYNLGLWIKERYGAFLHNKDPSLTRIESSSHNRAVTSANAIALGLFNTTSRDLKKESQLPTSLPRPNVPIYTPHSDKINDAVFRASETCNSYQTKLTDMFTTSSAVKDLMNDAELKSILTKLAKVSALNKYVDTASGTIHLQHLREVVDIISVKKLECDNGIKHACHQLPVVHTILSDTEWVYLQNIAYKIELMKYSTEIAGTNIGGLLLHTIIDRMMTTYQGLDNKNEETHMYVYSATDTTLWGILAALTEQENWFKLSGITGTLLPHGSALIFELHGTALDPAHLVVDLYFKPGNAVSGNATLIGTICGRGEIKDQCPLISLTQYVDMRVTKGKWCKECQNDSAEICIREAWKHALASTNGASSSSSSIPAACAEPSMSTAVSMKVGILIGMFLTVMIFGFCYFWVRRMKTKALHRHRTATTTARANTSNPMFDNADEDDDTNNNIT